MTNKLKYIIVDMNGLELPVVFSECFKHNELLEREHKIISAGICTIYNDDNKLRFTSMMGSISLKIEYDKFRSDKDYELLKQRLFSSIY